MIIHAIQLLRMDHNGVGADEMRNVSERRAVSAAYYALFHHINAAAASLIAPNVPAETNHRIQRWFEHAKMKEICGRFIKPQLDQPLRDLVGATAPPDLQNVARSFIDLQEARHNADYDLSFKLSSADAHQLITVAVRAIASWDRIATSAEANIFVLSLLMWKNWDKDR